MNTATIMNHVQDNAAAYAVGGILFLIVTLVFRKFMLPLIYHTTEYALYCSVAHVFLGGFVRAFSWFREETEFKNFKGETVESFVPYTTPLDLNFWNRALYNPQWIFWFEAVVALALLYVVIVIRPTRLKHNSYKSKKPAPGAISSGKPYAGLERPGQKMKPARSR